MMKKKSVAALFTAACLAAGSLAGCSGASSTASSEAADNTEASDAAQSADNTASDDDTKDLEDVTVILDYVANTNHTGMYVALDQGYYKDAGLNVSIVEPTEGATATLVAVGKGDFGISYQEDVTIALTSADPLPIKAIAAILQHNTSGFATYEGKGINSPKDFEGKTYAGWGGPGEEAVLKAVMTQDGADFSKLNMVISDGSGFEALKDKVDVMWFFEGWDNIKCELADFRSTICRSATLTAASTTILRSSLPTMILSKTNRKWLKNSSQPPKKAMNMRSKTRMRALRSCSNILRILPLNCFRNPRNIWLTSTWKILTSGVS